MTASAKVKHAAAMGRMAGSPALRRLGQSREMPAEANPEIAGATARLAMRVAGKCKSVVGKISSDSPPTAAPATRLKKIQIPDPAGLLGLDAVCRVPTKKSHGNSART